MKNKYLDSLGVKSYAGHYSKCKFPYNIIETVKYIPRSIRLYKQKRTCGGSSSENCWNLDYTSIEWLYTNLKIYLEDASCFVDLDYYKFNWHNKKYTQREAIEYILEKIENYLLSEELDKEYASLLMEKYYDGLSQLSEEKEDLLSKKSKEQTNKEIKAREELQDAIRLYAEIIFACWW